MPTSTLPVDGEIVTRGGKTYQYDSSKKVWNIYGSITPDNTGTVTAPIAKVWTGTQAEFQLLTHSDDVVYFVKD